MLFEILELDNGDVVLRRADEEGEPLVTIKFSDESESYLKNAKMEIARAMVQAGLEATSEMANAEPEEIESFPEFTTHSIH